MKTAIVILSIAVAALAWSAWRQAQRTEAVRAEMHEAIGNALFRLDGRIERATADR